MTVVKVNHKGRLYTGRNQNVCINSDIRSTATFPRLNYAVKGCGMGPLLVLSPCFRESVVATCKIGSFLCNLDILLQKNVIVLFFANKIIKWRSFEKKKRLFLTYFSRFFFFSFFFFCHQGNVTKNPSGLISLTYIHVFCSPY